MSREDDFAEEFLGYAIDPADERRPEEGPARSDGGSYAIAWALIGLTKAVDRVATQLKYLGTGDAATTMGAIEFLATHLGEKIKEAAQLVPVRDD